MTTPPIFFLVWSPQRGEPTRRHATLVEAQTEAHRLALKHPASPFHVLMSLEQYQGSCEVTRTDHAPQPLTSP